MLCNLSYVLCLSFKAVLSHLAAVLYYVLRVRYCLSVLVYAGVSLFIIVGPYVCLVVCVIYAYNLAWGGLKNGKNRGEPNGFCLVFVVRKNNFGILGKLKERSTFKFLFCFGRFSFVNSAIFIHSPYQTGSQPMSGRLYMLYIVILFKYVYII